MQSQFFEKTSHGIIITDNLFALQESNQFDNLSTELDARWNLVEKAWQLGISPRLLNVSFDRSLEILYSLDESAERIDATSAREALSGYQKGKCFYTFLPISTSSLAIDLCDVDHVIPHVFQSAFIKSGIDLNGVWNLVLANAETNRHDKRDKLPHARYIERLYRRNEYYIESNLPLAETIVNQTGRSPKHRERFLKDQMNLAIELRGHKDD